MDRFERFMVEASKVVVLLSPLWVVLLFLLTPFWLAASLVTIIVIVGIIGDMS